MKQLFIPAHFLHHVEELDVEMREETVIISGYKIKGFSFEVTDKIAKTYFVDEHAPVLTAHTRTKSVFEEISQQKFPPISTRVAYFFKEEGCNVDSDMDGNLAIASPKYESVATAIFDELEILMSLCGRNVSLHICADNAVYYPRNEDEVIHVVMNARPPGEGHVVQAAYIEDIMLHPSGREVAFSGGVHGYGKIVRDSEGTSIAQVVGSTLYLYMPIVEQYLHLIGGQGTSLFRTILRSAWNAFMTPCDEGDRKAMRIKTADQYIACSTGLEKAFHGHVDAEIKRTELEIERVSSIHIRKVSDLRRLRALRGSSEFSVDIDTMRAGWEFFDSHPLVHYIEQSRDDQLHLYTKDVLYPDTEGNIRNLGRFLIRIHSFENVEVWSTRLTHPRDIPHPHISTYGGVCFGNISLEIDNAIGEGRDIDAGKLVLMWLAEGYDPSIAAVKIEEWPLASEVTEETSVDLSHVYCE